MSAAWRIERFSGHHERVGFSCGNAQLDDWLINRVSQFEKRDLARTYVAVQAGSPVIRGYYAICCHRVTFESLPHELAKGLPSFDVPVVLLARLAVDRASQGLRLGELLLLDALRRAEALATQLGIRAVEVDAIDASASRFYMKYGFVPLVDRPDHLFLPMQIIRKLDL